MSAPWRRTQLAVWTRDNWRCQYCGKTVCPVGDTQPDAAHDAATIDHVLAVANGGTDAVDNLVTACWPCNNTKGQWGSPPAPQPTLGDVWSDLAPHERRLFEGAAA